MIGNWKRRVLVISAILLAAAVGGAMFGRGWLARNRISHLNSLSTSCTEFADQEDWESLEETASEWVGLDPDSADGWLNLAEAFQKQGRLEECVDCLLNVPKRDPKSRDALLYASDLQLHEARQPSQGIETLASLRQLAPGAEIVRKQLISLYAMTLQREKMIDEIQDAFKYHCEPPEAYVYLMIADHLSFTNGVQLNTRWLTAEPESEMFSVARAVQLVDTLKKLETTSPETEFQQKAGEEELDLLLKRYPQNQALLNYKIETAILDEDIEQVGQLLARIPEADVHDSLLLRYRGWHLMQTQHPQEAEDAYRRSISLMPLDWHAWHELAIVLRRQARLEEAESAARISIIGKDLRKECMGLSDASEGSSQLLKRICDYAFATGATDVAEAAAFRLNAFSPH